MTDLVWEVYGVETPEKEYRFHPTRRWRFDYAWVQRRIAVEIDGGVWSGGRHTRGPGFIKDMEKQNSANALGWHIFRFTPKQLKTGEAQNFIKGVLNGKS